MSDPQEDVQTPESKQSLVADGFPNFSPIIPEVVHATEDVLQLVPEPDEITIQRINIYHWVSDYADDIFQTLRETELKRWRIDYTSKQREQRPMLLRLLKVATDASKLTRSTLHLAVYFLDYFMDNYTIHVEKLKLTAMACLTVAAKMEEAEKDVPKLSDLNEAVGSAYSLRDYKTAEVKVLSAFDFDLLRPTVATFAEYFSNSFITLDDYHVYLHYWQGHEQYATFNTPLYSTYENMLTDLHGSLFELVDITLGYLEFSNVRPSVMAAACIAAVRRMHGVYPIWTPFLISLTECTEELVEPFAEALIALQKLNVTKARSIAAAEMPSPLATADSPLTDSPDSGVMSDVDVESSDEGSENLEDGDEQADGGSKPPPLDEEREDDAYYCSEYSQPAKRRKLF